jgi:glycosyltransferase involved in cell wall biosynthesis
MTQVAQLTNRFLDVSETFIFEPLRLMKDFHPDVFCFQRRNAEKFPYEPIYSLDELSAEEQKKNNFKAIFGREEYFSKLIKEKNIKVLHAHYGFGGIYALQFKKKNPKLKIMVNFYGLDVYQHTRNYLYRLQLKKLFKHGDLFMGCSAKMKNDLLKLGAPESKTKVQYGGADISKFNFSLPEVTEETVFLMCGRFVEKKGFEYGLKAFIDCCSPNSNIRLKIIGSGSLEEQLRKIAGNSSCSRKIEFLGPKSHDEYLREIEKAHIFLCPSVTAKNGDQEGLPTVLIESAAIGRPLIATDYSGIPEIVHHKQNGLLVKERDVFGLSEAIRTMVSKKNKWAEYAKYGRALVEENFELNNQTKKIENYYQDLLQK